MSVHRRIADLIPSHGEGQLMTRSGHIPPIKAGLLLAIVCAIIVGLHDAFAEDYVATIGGQNGTGR